MTAYRDDVWAADAPALPRSIWVVAWSSLAAQVVWLLDQGGRSANAVSIAGSVLIGMLVLGWVSAGVVRARTIRLVLARVVLGLSGVFEVLALVEHVDGSAIEDRETVLSLVALGITLVSLGALWRFHGSAWFRWHRDHRPARARTPITRLVAIGVVVGALGGLVSTADDGFDAGVRISAEVQR